MVCFATSEYQRSQNCSKEYKYVLQRGKPVIPVIMESDFAPSGDLAVLFGQTPRVNMPLNGDAFEGLMAEILGMIKYTFEQIKPQGPWVMLSYQRDCQAQVTRVADRLRQCGVTVWIDVEQLSKYESNVEGLSHAVEKAQVSKVQTRS